MRRRSAVLVGVALGVGMAYWLVAPFLLAGCNVAPLPVSPDMRCKYDPGCGATDYPDDPMLSAVRDAGPDR